MKKFTLTELVLEIGCVCLIAALLVPAFGKIRTASEVNLCFDNMMRIGKGFMQYAGDHGGMFPPYIPTGSALLILTRFIPMSRRKSCPETVFS